MTQRSEPPSASTSEPAGSDAEGVRAPRRGHGRTTLREVAEAAGVTAITVSRHLREPARVAPETAARIDDALRRLDYVPNRQAGLLASGRSNIVAALLPNLANSIFAETAQGLADTLQTAGCELLIAATGYSLEREEQLLRALLAWHPAAIVVTGRRRTREARRMLVDAQRAATPVVEVWDRHHPDAAPDAAPDAERAGEGFAQVGFDHDEVGRAMAAHLLGAGHRRMVYVDSGVAADYRAHERGQAFAAHARGHGAHVEIVVAPPGDGFDAGRLMLERIVGAGGGAPATAAAFANDLLAGGALLEAGRRGVAVPQRVALLGFGDFSASRQLNPALSSVWLPRREIGVAAAEVALAAMRDGVAPQSRQLSWVLVSRASTAVVVPPSPAACGDGT